MSFLHRHRSNAAAQASPPAEVPIPQNIPFPPAVENISTVQSSATPSAAAANGKSGRNGLIRRVSSIFANRKKRPSNTVITPLAVGTPSPAGSRWRITSDDSSLAESKESEDDIRRPSGLGRAASFSSNRSLPPSPFPAIDEESPFHITPTSGFERTRAMSSPNLLGSFMLVKAKLSRRSSISGRQSKTPSPPLVPQMPPEVILVVFSFLPRPTVATFAVTSRVFCAAARFVLYDTLDLRTLQPERVEKLVTLLAYRQDLTDIVRTFECHTWPSFFPPHSNINPVKMPSFSPALTATFTVAFQNMHLVTSLVLPSFDHTFLRHHSAFGLRRLTFLSRTMSAAETTQLFTWLDGQTNITHLAFPNLVEQEDTPGTPKHCDTPKGARYPNNTLTDSLNTNGLLFPSTPTITTPLCSPSSPSFPGRALPPTPKTPFNSPTLLPALTTLVASSSIISSLMASGSMSFKRPLNVVTLSINRTLYTGLRPAALLGTLQGITHLTIKFGPVVDRRTVGKVLSAGTVLCDAQDTRNQVLRVLEIELSDSTAGADQALYKIINTVIPRYHSLFTLRTQFSSHSSPNHVPSIAASESSAISISERDEGHFKAWSKHCPSLQSIQLLSGAIWERPLSSTNGV
ncbi:hypothetical protein Hypma_011064 [Hypsizygus marmoreus]|uniref:F-box domain-containing protein n=1 Tax=Hypsizygus marmoreus TaxID=39966 RepID=A0A369JLC8_HYPMA|nr:hypothetical protein Hypma_011064 [Hypsizygus marmoreus]